MRFAENSILATPEILKRKKGGELIVPVTVHASAFTNGVCKGGTPLDADGKIYAVVGGTKGTWTCAISTAFAEDEVITINGVNYTCGETESKENKVFAGASATLQATSLVAIVEDANFTLTQTSGTLTFTQKVADASGSAPTVTKTASTGAIGSVTAGTSAVDGTPNAVGILLDDVRVSNPNGALIKGDAVVNASVGASHSGIAYIDALKAKLSGIYFE